MKNLPSFYFIGLAILNLVIDTINNHFGIFDIIFVILAGIPLLLDKNWVYKLFGGVMSVISLYIVFAIFLSMVKDVQNEHMQPLWTYGMGYVVSFLTLSFGLLMAKIIKIRNRRNIITSG